MWIEKTKQGKYKACERFKCPITGKTRKVCITIDRNTKQARKDAEDALRGKIAAHYTQPQAITLRELANAYLENQKKEIKPSSYIQTKMAVERICDFLGSDAIVSKLQAGYVSKVIKTAGLTPCQTNRTLMFFKAMVRWGYITDMVESKEWLDKIQMVKIPRDKGKIESKYLEAAELRELLDNMPLEHWRLLTEFLALSGLRIGEAVALTVDDVGDYIHISRTWQTIAHRMSDTPKTEASIREVYVQPELARVVTKIKAYRGRVQLATGKRSDIFFPMPSGGLICTPSYYEYLANRSRECGHRISPHALRHTHVSLLAEQGVPLEVISRRLGHKDDAITREIYFHVTKKMKERENQMLSAVTIL